MTKKKVNKKNKIDSYSKNDLKNAHFSLFSNHNIQFSFFLLFLQQFSLINVPNLYTNSIQFYRIAIMVQLSLIFLLLMSNHE
jgi:hypothetical protein